MIGVKKPKDKWRLLCRNKVVSLGNIYCLMCTLFVAIVTGVARDGDIFMMYTVVNAPAVVTTAYNVSLRAITLNVVQPYLTSTGTVAFTNEPSTVSACNGTHVHSSNDKWQWGVNSTALHRRAKQETMNRHKKAAEQLMPRDHYVSFLTLYWQLL